MKEVETQQDALLAERFELALERIGGLADPDQQDSGASQRYASYFRETAAYVKKLLVEWDDQMHQRLEDIPLTVLRERNHRLYADILPERYETCYGNPAYAVSLFGEDTGRLLAFLYAELHSQIAAV